MSDLLRCSPKIGGFTDTLCPALWRSVEGTVLADSKGLHAARIIDGPTGANFGIKITLASGDYIKTGINIRRLINFCPFCGGILHDQPLTESL